MTIRVELHAPREGGLFHSGLVIGGTRGQYKLKMNIREAFRRAATGTLQVTPFFGPPYASIGKILRRNPTPFLLVRHPKFLHADDHQMRNTHGLASSLAEFSVG